ncbi:MAG: TIGR03905 family TSCPD domain-containing protein [Fusobacteriaceae bacterium]|nr:TIGR03905 family TSCPD domain-containing protein [Fusobacteriaceae bacterium]
MKNFKTSGVCAKEINFSIDSGIIKKVSFTGGCNGNLKGMGLLLEGMKVEDVISKLEGTKCGPRDTSCPDQLAKALKEYVI